MGAQINSEIKNEMLPFIESNFRKISQREIARRLNIGKTTINRWSKELGLFYIKHTSNEEFFDELNNDSAYVLGYIFTDGNVSWNTKKSYWSLTITSSEKDKNHLENIRKLLSSTKPLLYSPKTKSYRLIATNKKLCQKLMKLGVTPNKSLTINFPNIPKEQLRHFIRDVIDGDGSVDYVNREKSPHFEIRIYSGSENFLKRLSKVLNKEICISTKIKKVHKNTFMLRYTCARGKILANWIYNCTELYLDRKFNQYLNMKKMEVVVPDK